MSPACSGRSQVLVIGAGPAGSAAAIVLARAGVDVCLLDRVRFPRAKTCGDAVSNGGMDLIDALGAGERVAAGPCAPMRAASVVFPDGQRVTRTYAAPGCIIPRAALDQALRGAAEAAGARVMEGYAVRELGRAPAGEVIGAHGEGLRWEADVTIAADGPFSVGLTALGCERPRGRHVAVAATAYLRGVRFPAGEATADHYLLPDLARGYAWIFPAVDGLANVGVYQRKDAYARSGDRLQASLAAFLTRHPERFADAKQVGPVRTWSLPLAPAPHRIAGPGLLLAGDAAGLVDPLSGEGIWQALYSGRHAGLTALSLLARPRAAERIWRTYERLVVTRVARPGYGKRIVQRALDQVVAHRLYRWGPLIHGMRYAYERGLLEISKRR